MDENTKMMLARVLDMNEIELRAALLTIIGGMSVENAIDQAYSPYKRQSIKGNHPKNAVLGDQ